MPKFRKKPVVIEAMQLVEGQPIPDGLCLNDCHIQNGDTVAHIHTLEGTMRADEGDWIIKGVKGEFYPCKDDIFEATYEPVD